MLTWVIGAGGLFGQALVRASENVFHAQRIPWEDGTAALAALSESLSAFRRQTPEDWSIIWAAGHATTSSSPEQTAAEFRLFSAFVEHLGQNTPSGRGVFGLTSSAGGVYAGSSDPPFSSSTSPVPVSAYGRLKLDQEQVAQTLSPRIPVVSLRLSNLYGPGQNLRKLQGIISHLALATITRNPVKIFVPLDTLRDYIYVDDAAIYAMHWIKEAGQNQASGVKVIASSQPQTLGRIVALMNEISRVRIPVAAGFDDSAAVQAHDLRMFPDSDPTTERMALTQLPCGMKRTLAHISDLHANAAIVA
ncbi:NAD-dependent epimerase/dehydratase family protein [Candidatus Nanopelagicales bacterium]|nr:NAD-dependent epimerase/dehydratase family protein [Candidatus Nanopelagicales bacterium]